jgi:hypothetical protein
MDSLGVGIEKEQKIISAIHEAVRIRCRRSGADFHKVIVIEKAHGRKSAIGEQVGEKDGGPSFHAALRINIRRQHRRVKVQPVSAERATILFACKRGRGWQCFGSRLTFFAPAVGDPAGAACYGIGSDPDRTFRGFAVWQDYARIKSLLLKIQHFFTPVDYMAVALLIFEIYISIPGSVIITIFYMFDEKIQEALLSNT